MAKQVKIVGLKSKEDSEEELTALINSGWVIVAAGGSDRAGYKGAFVILQKDN